LCVAGRRCTRLAVPTILYRFHAQQVTASAGYRNLAFAEPDFAASYAALSKRVLDTEPAWYGDLHGDGAPTADGHTRLLAFAAAMKDAAAPLRPLQRDLVRRKVAAAVTAVEGRWS
jgi:hypothetical protein